MFESHMTVEEQQIRAAVQFEAIRTAMHLLTSALEDRVEGEDGDELVEVGAVEKALATIKAVRGGALDHAVCGRVMDAEMRATRAETEASQLRHEIDLLRQALAVRAA